MNFEEWLSERHGNRRGFGPSSIMIGDGVTPIVDSGAVMEMFGTLAVSALLVEEVAETTLKVNLGDKSFVVPRIFFRRQP